MRPLLFALALLSFSSVALAEGTVDSRVARMIERARAEVVHGVTYDPSYVALGYPNGDVAADHGVCTDVVVRALRAVGIDLQSRVHEDILARPRAYARFVARPDANIDHRRVGPLTIWLDANARRLPPAPDTFVAGDVVVWSLHRNGRPEHIGMVSDRRGPRGLPLVIHNIGPAPSEDDCLDSWELLAHFRIPG